MIGIKLDISNLFLIAVAERGILRKPRFFRLPQERFVRQIIYFVRNGSLAST